jgi:uncharacterized protein (DUF488 family)
VDDSSVTHNSLLLQGRRVPYLDILSIGILTSRVFKSTKLSSVTVFTIGHSTRTIEDFIALLRYRHIQSLADVRSFPGSKRHPQFNRTALSKALNDAGITYIHMVTLGGKRKETESATPIIYARNAPFAHYAAYAKTPMFRAGLTELETQARERTVAIMCAEADWRHCHRSVITEKLIEDGFAVTHIMSAEHDRAAERSPALPGF